MASSNRGRRVWDRAPEALGRRWPALAPEDGATMVEYSIMLGSIAAVCVLAVTALGQKVLEMFESVPPF